MQLDIYLKERLSSKPIGFMMHLICGYPSFEENWKALELMDKYGVDLVELQFPFSEPSADGALFVQANEKSLASGTNVKQCFEFMKKVSEKFSFKTLMMGYYNTVYKFGEKAFIKVLKESGAVGYIIPDLPPIEEATSLQKEALIQGLSPIYLMTPTTGNQRLKQIAQQASSFIYVVARKGVTGEKTYIDDSLEIYLQRCRSATSLPLAVGFGISDAKDIRYLTDKADLAIIGTASLQAWEEEQEEGFEKFLQEITS